jgi:hypothetical protein
MSYFKVNTHEVIHKGNVVAIVRGTKDSVGSSRIIRRENPSILLKMRTDTLGRRWERTWGEEKSW